MCPLFNLSTNFYVFVTTNYQAEHPGLENAAKKVLGKFLLLRKVSMAGFFERYVPAGAIAVPAGAIAAGALLVC